MKSAETEPSSLSSSLEEVFSDASDSDTPTIASSSDSEADIGSCSSRIAGGSPRATENAASHA